MIVWVCIVLAGIALTALTWMRIEATGYRVRYDDVESALVPNAFQRYRILFITDIHRREISYQRLQELELCPDCILLGGDITEKGVPWDRVRANLEVLRRIAPVYGVLGNHDLVAGSNKLEKLFSELGLTLLKDRTVKLEKDGCSIALSGVMQPASRKHQYSRFRGNPRIGQYHILLVHDPIWILGKRNISADLILAGHTHGGQVILPLLGAIRLKGFYKKYFAGWYNLRQKSNSFIRLLISRGFGTSHIPLRLGCPSEMHLITLKKP
ncbi:metallophosphoesterase [Paenibacillus sp. GCM10028914]|uniref:metallophosphoesterase n=1 Tax=Paenibacillus sp. GCM10028914 TaxID=3273416 RepID=UPI003618E236